MLINKKILFYVMLTETLLDSGMRMAFFDHSTVGVGAPEIGMSILMGSPARTLILRPIIPSK